MLHYLKIYLILLGFILLLAVVQTAERFESFEHYLNVGYGNVPYSIKK